MAKNMYSSQDYRSLLSTRQTEQAIKELKDFFQLNLATELNLSRVTAAMFVEKGSGINDDLNGIEKPVSFTPKDTGTTLEIVQSLAKWKRLMLAELGFEPNYGLFTDMNAIRPDEDLDNVHSVYVDQWDWEKVITEKDRTVGYLKKTVGRIFSILKRAEFFVYERYPQISPILPEDITFFHAEELARQYPGKTPFERECAVAEKYGAVFIIGIGGVLSDGKIHDGRAPDYDDWITPNEEGFKGLNGDIIVWNPMFKRAFEISSMGIRVNKESLLEQLAIRGAENRKELFWHKKLLNGELPLSIGGGIGQSRLCMYFLRKAHIGEVQSSVWPKEMIAQCRSNNISLL